MTRDERDALLGAAEQRWHLWGPNSGGGEELVFAKGRLFVFAYGDAVQGDSDVTEVDLRTFERAWSGQEQAREAIVWLRARGHIQ